MSIGEMLSFINREPKETKKSFGDLGRLSMAEVFSEFAMSFPFHAKEKEKDGIKDFMVFKDIDYHETGEDPYFKEIHLGIPAEMTYLPIARLVASGIGLSLSLSFDAVEDIKIALTEALSNAVKHAYTGNETEHRILITFRIEENKLLITVKDSGKGMDTTFPKPGQVPYSRGNGLGLFLIKSLMDEVGLSSVIDDGTEVRMVKFLPNGEKADA